MYKYECYGLALDSTISLDGVPRCREKTNVPVVIKRGRLRVPPVESLQNGRFVEASGEEIFIFWQHIGGMLVREGKEIIVDPLAEVRDATLGPVITGVGLGLVLHQRGVLALHSSAVAVDGSTVAFIGDKGFGKSTTAAAMVARGHTFVTDDILAIDESRSGGEVSVFPGSPQLKLWPDAVRATSDDNPEMLARVHPLAPKRSKSIDEGFQGEPLPLRCIYVLDYVADGDASCAATVRAISMQRAFRQLVTHTYAARFVGNGAASSWHLQACAALLRRVPIRKLVRRPSLESLGEIVEAIESDSRGAVEQRRINESPMTVAAY